MGTSRKLTGLLAHRLREVFQAFYLHALCSIPLDEKHPFDVYLSLPDAFAACQPANLTPIPLLEGFLKIEPLPPTLNPPLRSTACHLGLQNATGHDNKLWLPWN